MTAETAPDRAPRWFQRALPVAGLVALAAAALTFLVPGVRDELALSATHQPQPYVALAFGRAADGTVKTCVTKGRSVAVRFDVESHLPESRELDYVVTVGGTEQAGTVLVEPGRTARVDVAAPRPTAKKYEIEVRLPELGQHVLAHCQGRRS